MVSAPLAASGDASPSGTRQKAKPKKADARTLSAAELAHYFEPYEAQVKECYRKYALNQKTATGDVRLEMIIHRDGHLFFFDVVAPGVRGKKLSRCIKKRSRAWRFPRRRGFTTATIPFRFVKTHVPGAGPIKSCPSRRGCVKVNGKWRPR